MCMIFVVLVRIKCVFSLWTLAWNWNSSL